MEYVITWHDNDPPTQPLLDLEGWLRVIGGVSRSRVIGFDDSFEPLVARYSSTSSQASTSQAWSDAHVEEVMQRLLSQRLWSFQNAICDTVVLWDRSCMTSWAHVPTITSDNFISKLFYLF